MTFDSYEVQLLVAIGKRCKPNSPKPYRAWTHLKPLYGIPEFGNAISKLIRGGFLQRGQGFSVKPTKNGYMIIDQWKAYRHELRRRPPLYGRVIWDQPIELEFKQAA